MVRGSDAWKHFVRGDDNKATCIHCGMVLKIVNSATSSLLRHTKGQHPFEFHQNADSLNGQAPGEESTDEMKTPGFSVEIKEEPIEPETQGGIDRLLESLNPTEEENGIDLSRQQDELLRQCLKPISVSEYLIRAINNNQEEISEQQPGPSKSPLISRNFARKRSQQKTSKSNQFDLEPTIKRIKKLEEQAWKLMPIRKMTRAQVTDKILEQKVLRGIKWNDVAKELGMSPTWTVATCLGQGTASAEHAAKLAKIFSLTDNEALWLQQIPTRTGPEKVPNDPLLYRLHEALGVYGPAMKELIHEEFGDGICSAIDFTVDIQREQNTNGDRVKMIWSGKFLPYKPF